MISIIFLMVGILTGAFFPVQAAINAKLGSNAKTPLTASFVAFSLGSVILFIVSLIFARESIGLIDFSYPIWVFVGGAFAGAIFNVSNIVLFGKIGASTTTILTVTGQMIMGLMIDHFGLFNMPVSSITIKKTIAVLLMVGGIFLVQKSGATGNNGEKSKKNIWILVGIAVGIFPPLQAAFNGQLRMATNSLIISTFISFFVGALILGAMLLITQKKIEIPRVDKNTSEKLPLWVYSGGLFGIFIVGGNIAVIHKLGSILTTTLFLFGQILMSVVIDYFGFFGIEKRSPSREKIIAIGAMIIGIIMIK